MKKRILFVDDERCVLDGLRRSLRRYRDRWETCYVEGGQAALVEMQKSPFDVVVSDMRMPGMDGFELLSYVREHHPNTLRLILSGQTEQEIALRSIAVSHQFLAKPCEGERLRRILDRACAVRDLCTDERHRGILSRLATLPSAPKLYLELNRAMNDEMTSAGDVAKIVEQDMAMSSKLLQIVNSAYLGLPREVSRIRDAVAFLGMGTIRSLALAQGAFTALKHNAAFRPEDLRREQARAMLTGSVARSLCPDPKLGDQAFLAGMLHDLGVMILATQFPLEFSLCKAEQGHQAQDQEREQAAFGTTHAKVGAFLLGSWGLPIRVTEAVAFHHEPSIVAHEEFDVVTAVHVASALVGDLLPTHTLKTSKTVLNRAYLERLGLEGKLQGWRDKAEEIAQTTGEQSDAA